jgi:GNAT superfamily N-acetyltransferase
MFAVDALRALDPIPVGDTCIHIRRAGLQDIEQVMALQDELWEYIKGPPIFILNERYDRKYYEAWLQDPGKVVWLACSQEKPLAFMRMGPADEDVCAIIVDEKTTSIYAAFTREQARCKGIATALLAHALEFARDCSYERCAVPFEPMNPPGSRFWLRHFQPVCYSFLRNIDDRLAQG